MRFHWLWASVLGTLGTLLMTIPAEAARLASWRFESRSNQLVFTTDEGVQPRAQLIANPTRVVIDLPGTSLGNATRNQIVGGAIREVRVGQFDAETTRIVIELAPGYTLDPQQVRVRGATPTQWTVQLPTPERLDPSEVPDQPSTASATVLESVRVTGDGLFIRTAGAAPEVEVRRDEGRTPRIAFELQNTTVSPQLTRREITVNRYGVRSLRISEVQGRPTSSRVTLELTDRNFNWQVLPSGFGGVVLLPPRGSSVGQSPQLPESTPTPPEPNNLANVVGLELSDDGRQLVVRTDQPIRYSSGWDRAANTYRITLEGARLPSRVPGPTLGNRSPLQSIRLRQEDAETVVVLVQPATGVRLGDLTQPDGETLVLSLGGVARPPQPVPSGELPRVDRRVTVVIDPGHGGVDPGAVGINGLQEIQVAFPISLEIASILERQGVNVVLTRSDNRTLELEPRVQIAERANADYFVSIHANAISLSRPDVNGLEVYYYSDGGRQLAASIHSSVLNSIGMNDRGVRQARFYVIRNTSMPAVLVEVGFVTGAQDAPRLADPQFRRQMAEAIARGILQHIQGR